MGICTSIVLVMTISTFKKLDPRLVLVVKPLQSLPQPVASDCVRHLQNQCWPGERKMPWRNIPSWGPVGSGPVHSLVSLLSTVIRRPETRERKKETASHCQPSHTQSTVAAKDNLLDKKTPHFRVFVSDILSDNKQLWSGAH